MTTEELLMGLAVIRELTGTQKNDLESTVDAVRAAFAPADSVTAPAGAGVAHALSDARIEAMPVWRNFVGLWPESRREIVDAVVDLLTTPPAQAADSVLEDAARWRELREQHESDEALCCVFAPNDMRECLVPVGSLPGELDAFMDAERAARKQGASHD